jgi:N,N'-diacetylchitobiose transport system permease protein
MIEREPRSLIIPDGLHNERIDTALSRLLGLSRTVVVGLIEAAEIDGANPRQVFRNIIFPMLLPVYVILISLSIIWDFQVFSHIWIFLDSRPSADYYTIAIYAFQKSFGLSEYGKGAAISIVMIVALIGVTGYYLRQMMKMGDE